MLPKTITVFRHSTLMTWSKLSPFWKRLKKLTLRLLSRRLQGRENLPATRWFATWLRPELKCIRNCRFVCTRIMVHLSTSANQLWLTDILRLWWTVRWKLTAKLLLPLNIMFTLPRKSLPVLMPSALLSKANSALSALWKPAKGIKKTDTALKALLIRNVW